MKRRGSVLITAMFVIMILSAFIAVGFTRSSQELLASEAFVAKSKATAAAEAGIDVLYRRLADPMVYLTACGLSIQSPTQMYAATVECISSADRQITSTGTAALRTGTVTSTIVAHIYRPPAQQLDSYTIWAAKSASIVGNAYGVVGDVISSQNITNAQNIDGKITVSSNASVLPKLNLSALYAIAQSQGNVYDGATLSVDKLPTEFFHASDGMSAPVPNIVIINGDLTIKGNTPIVGGFIIVTGTVTMDGNTQVEGMLYCNHYTANGGGNGITVHGAVWSNNVEANGNIQVNGSSDYVAAVSNLNPQLGYALVSWEQTQ